MNPVRLLRRENAFLLSTGQRPWGQRERIQNDVTPSGPTLRQFDARGSIVSERVASSSCGAGSTNFITARAPRRLRRRLLPPARQSRVHVHPDGGAVLRPRRASRGRSHRRFRRALLRALPAREREDAVLPRILHPAPPSRTASITAAARTRSITQTSRSGTSCLARSRTPSTSRSRPASTTARPRASPRCSSAEMSRRLRGSSSRRAAPPGVH